MVATCDLRPYGDEDHAWWVASDLAELATRAAAARGPRARHRRRLDDAGVVDAATRRSSAPSTSAPAAGCRRCTSAPMPGTSPSPTSPSGRWPTRGSTRCSTGASGRSSRARCSIPLRDDGSGSSSATRRSSSRPGRRMSRCSSTATAAPPATPSSPTSCARSATTSSPAASPSSSATGRSSATPTGATGCAAGWRAPASTPGSCSATCRTRREYAETWARDGGHHSATTEFAPMYAAWLDDFASRGVSAIGFGVITLQRPATEREPFVDLDGGGPGRWPHPWAPRCSRGCGRGPGWPSTATTSCSPSRGGAPTTSPRSGTAAPAPRTPSVILLRQGGGLGRAVQLDTAMAALASVCDGDLTAASGADRDRRAARPQDDERAAAPRRCR